MYPATVTEMIVSRRLKVLCRISVLLFPSMACCLVLICSLPPAWSEIMLDITQIFKPWRQASRQEADHVCCPEHQLSKSLENWMSVHAPNNHIMNNGNMQQHANGNGMMLVDADGCTGGNIPDGAYAPNGTSSSVQAPIRITRRINVRIQGSLSDFAQVSCIRLMSEILMSEVSV